MNSLARRALFRPLPRISRALTPARHATTSPDAHKSHKNVLTASAKRDPELYVLFFIMTGALGLAGWYFARSPTSATSEAAVAVVADSEPWKTGGDGKYQYIPKNNPFRGSREAPSALRESIIPDVTLPKELHDRFNKYGKDIMQWGVEAEEEEEEGEGEGEEKGEGEGGEEGREE